MASTLLSVAAFRKYYYHKQSVAAIEALGRGPALLAITTHPQKSQLLPLNLAHVASQPNARAAAATGQADTI